MATLADAPTKGLSYTATPSNLSGVTGADGSFSYKVGDTVTFTLPAGSGAPVTIAAVMMNSTSASAGTNIISVLGMPNGNAIAQVLQSLGTASGVTQLDVTNAGSALTSAQVTGLNNFITSGSVPTAVAPLVTVTADSALTNAMNYVGSLTAQPLPATLSSLMTGHAFFYLGKSSQLDGSVRKPRGLTFTDPTTGAFSTLCVNTRHMATDTAHSTSYVQCSDPGFLQRGTTTFNDASNTATITATITGGTYTNTITVPMLNTQFGVFNSVEALNGTADQTTAGSYTALDPALTGANLAGKSLTITGDALECPTDGLIKISFPTAATFSAVCNTPADTFTSAGGVTQAMAGSAIVPGILVLTDTGSSNAKYLGLALGSTIAAGGSVAFLNQGNTTATNGDTPCLTVAAQCGFGRMASIRAVQ